MSYVRGALLRVAEALERVASGEAIDDSTLIEAALTLRTYADLRGDTDLLDAAEGLKRLATVGELPLDAVGRHLAAVLARRLRAEASA